MIKIYSLIALLSYCAVVLAQTPVPPALYTDAEDIIAELERSAAERPAMAVSRIQLEDEYRINLIRRTAAAGAILHEVGHELHYITAGAGTLVTGGVIVRGENGAPATIQGGLERHVTAGDAILIPAGTPHWYSAVDESVSYLEVRFNVEAD